MRSGISRKMHRGVMNSVKWVSHIDDLQKLMEKRSISALQYMGGAIRNQTTRGMGRAKRKRSTPGNPVNSPPPARKLKTTTHFAVIKDKKMGPRVVVGPLKTWAPSKWESPVSAPSVPALLEFGGKNRVHHPKGGIHVPRTFASSSLIRREKARRLRAWRKKTKNRGTAHTPKISLRKIKTVLVPNGTYTILPRPSARIGFNKAVVQTNKPLLRAFRIAGIENPPNWRQTIDSNPRF